MLFPEKEFLTVSELNGLVREVLNTGFPSAVWVCGELQGFDRNRDKRHIFFELCEKDPQTQDILARIGLVIFSGRRAAIEEILAGSENAFQLKDDIEVKFLCKVDFYPPHGAVRLVVESIDPVYTLGKIAQERQRLIALLRQKGVLDKNKALVLPEVPLKIGLITAHDSAAYNDFLSELRLSGFGFQVFVRNTAMQGKNAEGDVCRALDIFERQHTVDVIVITRGGGSIAELSCFDSQAIAERIAASSLPVLSGIGHEINVTVTDLAAHTYLKTPTAIAGFLVERVDQFLTDLEEKGFQVVAAGREKVAEQKQYLRQLATGIQSQTIGFLRRHEQKLAQIGQAIIRDPRRILAGAREQLARRQKDMGQDVSAQFQNARKKIEHFQKLMEMADPAQTLRRGFSITRDAQGCILKSVAKIKNQQQVITTLADGKVTSQVESVQKGEASWSR